MSFTVVIPSRYAARRLPGKPLLDIGDKPMIQHVYERAVESGARRVIVATDDSRIAKAVSGFGGDVCMTRASHRSGTDRIAEVAEQCAFPDTQAVVNLQGDEPFMPASVIRQVADNLERQTAASMATLYAPIVDVSELFDPNIVKLVCDVNGMAIYFSRACIPWDRDGFARHQDRLPENTRYFRHIGLYAYRAGFLREFVSWEPAPLEIAESLEQLRAIWQGHKIHAAEALEIPMHGVDTERDLAALRNNFN